MYISSAATNVEESRTPEPVSTRCEAFPTYVPYLLIGAGTASFGAFRSIKARDPTAKVKNCFYILFVFLKENIKLLCQVYYTLQSNSVMWMA